MFFKKKKKPKLEEPPSFIPTLPEEIPTTLPEIKIKDVGKELMKKTVEIPELPKKVEKEELKQLQPEVSPETLEPLEPKIETEKRPEELVKGPIFVKINKYKSVLELLGKISNQVKDIEADFSKLKEIKEKEDEEIKKLDEGIEQIKKRLEEMERNLFSKLE